MKSNRVKSCARESGAASIIIVLLVSLAVTASTTAVIQSLRNTKEIGVAVNSVLHAKTGMWAGVEAFRRYLQLINVTTITALDGTTTVIALDPSYGNISAEDIAVVNIGTNVYRISAKIVNRHSVARSSASQEVVFDLIGSSGTALPLVPSVHFNGDLDVNGGIELVNSGDAVDLVVNGDVALGGVSVNPINSIFSTGSVTIGSAVTLDSIFAHDDVTLANTTVHTVETLGKFTASGSASVQNVWANDDVTIDASGRFENVNSVRNIYANSGGLGQGRLTAGEAIEINGGWADSVNAVGDVSINSWVTVGDVVSMGDVSCPSKWWTHVSSISANGVVPEDNCPSSAGSLTVTSNASNVVVPMRPLEAREVDDPTIDVWELRDDANYFVKYNASINRIQVVVNHMNNVVDGTLFTIGKYRNVGGTPSYNDYLCHIVNNAGICQAPVVPMFPLCVGQSPWNGCISYNSGSDTFVVSPNQTAPGIMFFDGNVSLRDGRGYTSILASGDIGTSGSFESWAANFGSYENVCQAKADHVVESVRSRYMQAFSLYFPTNLCDVTNSTYTPVAAGNIGLAAGGVNPDPLINPLREYNGGNIELGNKSDIVGLVLAGNFLNTGGSVRIQGLVQSGAYGESATGGNNLGGSTTIDLNDTSDYNSTQTPFIDEPPIAPLVFTATMLWGRPL